ncbi:MULTISPECIES: hypothetical protein [unclassified Rhizobium]|uniref:hypothetical protein n=1 Tax=unclassified Rhizobium TaxID=2613769 RepID=UPI0014054B6D|nr:MULTISPECIES: hypothetical protein [unclassified Rhizobium]MBB3396549.1 hypothetical protein [Rhizobium sp. BK060]MBB4170295.1 hypothetical protein [Rhizobium sp. BK538]
MIGARAGIVRLAWRMSALANAALGFEQLDMRSVRRNAMRDEGRIRKLAFPIL